MSICSPAVISERSKQGMDSLKEMIVLLARHDTVRDLGETKLAKLLYFIDAEAVRELGRSITGADYIKHEHGPMPSRQDRAIKQLSRARDIDVTKQTLHGKELHRVAASREPRRDLFSHEELQIVEAVVRKLGKWTAAELSDRSHQEIAWRDARYLDKLDPALIPYGSEEDPEGL